MLKKSILLVEDNPDDETLTLRALKKDSAVNEVVVAHDGVEALNYLFAAGSHSDGDTNALPQLVLLDLKLPKVDGFQVLHRIRTDERTKLVPVVILTCSDEEQDLFESYRLGANSYIRKPVDFTHFIKAVEQLKAYWLDLNEPPPYQQREKLN